MYYSIQKEVDYENGCFDLLINWNVPQIIQGQSEKSGYIVQKIRRETQASETFMNSVSREIDNFQHEYYEAWEVDKGIIILDKDYGFHDEWSYKVGAYSGMLEDYKIKYRTCGRVKVTGLVYWIGKDMPEYDAIQKVFRKGAIKCAGELLATCKFAEAAQLHPICIREKSGTWDFREDENFVNAIVIYTKINQKDHKKWIEDIEGTFGGLAVWKQITDKIYAMKL